MATMEKDPIPPSSSTTANMSNINTNPPPLYRRISRPQNLHLEIINSPSIPSTSQAAMLQTDVLKQNINMNSNNPSMICDHATTATSLNICSNSSSSYSDTSSRSSTPTRSTASSATTDDGSSIATPTLESASPIFPSPSSLSSLSSSSHPEFTFSSNSAAPADTATRLLLRDRYLDSLQRPIIVGTSTTSGSISSRGNSLDIPRTVYQDPKLLVPAPQSPQKSLLEIFTPPETPTPSRNGSGNQKESKKIKLDKSVPPPRFHLGSQQQQNKKRDTTAATTEPLSSLLLLPADWSDMGGIDNRVTAHPATEENENEINGILQPLGAYELDDPKQPTKLGSGAWSNVYKGILHSKTTKKPLLIAVKRPLNTFSIPALKREATILSHIYKRVGSSNNGHNSIIPFHGFDASTTSILMTALSGDNLEQFTTRCRTSLPRDTSNFNALKLPVVGITQWLFIAERLISAFAFLKSAGVIHGDVKPQNILTKPFDRSLLDGDNNGGGKYDWISEEETMGLVEPIVADFSSSYVVDSAGSISDDEEAINAVTTIYCAPELLAAFLTPPTTPTKPTSSLSPPSAQLKSDPRPLPTFSSDHYGLCMTLLQCAIGSHPYSAAKMDIQRNIWVRQGDPMAFARADERGFRCRNGGAVDRLLRGCFGKTAEGRVGVEELVGRVEGLCGEWRERKGEDAWVWGGRLG
ncbi:hypothetical protein TWF225_001103 [Orbilia oligospora]|nr:hypothetical protein TWF225_001103 [Orbilia oligospora]KAF3256665.1 hypothetical protein TWF217_006351 [Orbilia oligospora]KAF3268726.1 hypothetical protein TWF128_007094 [Orbilia oligospora]KAF3297386.1 hypothetical protein TWF132_007483 [Orbilia oligospora]